MDLTNSVPVGKLLTKHEPVSELPENEHGTTA